MRRAIGVTTSEHIVAGLVEENRLVGSRLVYEEDSDFEPLHGMPVTAIAQCLADEIKNTAGAEKVDAIGIGLPGIIRDGFIEDSPNLKQLKGAHIRDLVTDALRKAGILAPVHVYNDADIMAAGIAGTRGHLDRMIRVWTLGNGIGFGIYPWREGIWEGGHVVVSLDPRERYCGCGGEGTWKASWAFGPCGFAFSTWNPTRFSRTHIAETRAVWNF